MDLCVMLGLSIMALTDATAGDLQGNLFDKSEVRAN
jgi:hypothetical protein